MPVTVLGSGMSAQRRATIADVAAASGVGVGTVSRVINGASNVREATRRSVQKVIEQLGYRPSHLAVSLSRGTPRTVAIVVPHLTRPSAVMRLAGALAVLDEQGYDTVVCNVDTPQQRDHHLAALTSRHRADGVIVVSLRLSLDQLGIFRKAAVPLVTVDVMAAGVPQTVTDDVAGGRLATGHLLALGHRRIGFVGDTKRRTSAADLGFATSQHRLSGYRQALAAAGIGYDPALVRRGPHGPANAEALATELLRRPDRPSAIFAASDTQAMGVLAAADRCGIPVPDQLSVIGFDDIESAMLLGLSTVRQPLEDSGAEGARRLCALLRGEQVTPLRQQLAVEVVSRSSTARFRVDQPPTGGPLVDHASSRRRSQPPQERYIELGSPGHGRPGWREEYG
ncbi:MAG TPA: LacI family DNA-binding transcriptional regulator [Streptosporangiaceae bacterium]